MDELPLNANDRKQRPASPCVSICTLDDADQCLGCGRSLVQITGWMRMTAEEQWSVIDEIRALGAPARENAG